MDGLIMAAQMILGLSIMVGLHEFGHLLAAKAFGMKVEQYSIGFPPRIFKFKFGETVYSIGAIPLGGYVKISGMIDESLDLEKMKEEPQPWEFRSKPAWQRLIVMMGGIVMNIITGIIIFIIMTYSFGDSYLSKAELNKNGIEAFSLGREIGLKTGDKILKVNGKDYDKFDDLLDPDNLLASNASYTVERDGKIIEIPIPSDFIEHLSSSKNSDTVNFISPLSRFTVGEIEKGSGADSAGLKTGDKILSIDGKPVEYFYQMKNELQKLKGQAIHVSILRNNDTIPLHINVSADGTLGFIADNLDYELSTTNYTLLQAIPIGTASAFNIVFINAKAIGKIVTGQLDFRKTMMGPIGIAKTFGSTWNWLRFWNLIGLLSMILAFMNFLPIPALDGGHVMFLGYEMVSGRKPSDKFMEVSQKVGMVILLSLMVFVIFNDIIQQIF